MFVWLAMIPLSVAQEAGADLPVLPGNIDYETYVALEEARQLMKLDIRDAQIQHALESYLGHDPGSSDYTLDDLHALQEIATDFGETGLSDVFASFVTMPDDLSDPEIYYSDHGYPEFGQTTSALSACDTGDLEGVFGPGQRMKWKVTEGQSTTGLLPVNTLRGANADVECRMVFPGSGWTNNAQLVPVTLSNLLWPSWQNAGMSMSLFTNQGAATGPESITTFRTATTTLSAGMFLDADQASAGDTFAMVCTANAYTIIDNERNDFGGLAWCIDVEVETNETPCDSTFPPSVTVNGTERPVRPGSQVVVSADWRFSNATQVGNYCRTDPEPELKVGGSRVSVLASETPNDSGTGNVEFRVSGGRSKHLVEVPSGSTSGRGHVELDLVGGSNWPGSGKYSIISARIPVDILQGPEFGTTRSLSCSGTSLDYCWRFQNYLTPTTATAPTPGVPFTNTFQVSNYGNADLTVSLGTPSNSMFTLSGPTSGTIAPNHVGSGGWQNAAPFDVTFNTPTQADLPNLCTRDGAFWVCQGELQITTNDADEPTATVGLYTRMHATQGVLVLEDDQGNALPSTIDLGPISLGETSTVGSAPNETCPAGHFLRRFEVRNTGVQSTLHAWAPAPTATNVAGLHLLNGTQSASVRPNDTLPLDVCILPTETGTFERTIEVWQSIFPHDALDITLRWEAVTPIRVTVDGQDVSDQAVVDFGQVSGLVVAPRSMGVLEITNQTSPARDLAVVPYWLAGWSDWDLVGIADSMGNPFAANQARYLQPGEQSEYRIDLDNLSIGSRSGTVRVAFGEPTGTSGTQATGYTSEGDLDFDAEAEIMGATVPTWPVEVGPPPGW